MGREEDCKQISLACVGSAHSISATLGLPLFTACVLSQSTLLRLQVALPRNCLKRALGCVHFPGLNRSGSGSLVLHKGADSVGLSFMPFPGLSSSGDRALGECTLPRLRGASYRLPCLSHSVSWVHSGSAVSGLLCVSSGELNSGCDPPEDVIRPESQEVLASDWEPARSLVEDTVSEAEIAPFQFWLPPACLPASCGGWAGPQLASFPLVFAQSFVL